MCGFFFFFLLFKNFRVGFLKTITQIIQIPEFVLHIMEPGGLFYEKSEETFNNAGVQLLTYSIREGCNGYYNSNRQMCS